MPDKVFCRVSSPLPIFSALIPGDLQLGDFLDFGYFRMGRGVDIDFLGIQQSSTQDQHYGPRILELFQRLDYVIHSFAQDGIIFL